MIFHEADPLTRQKQIERLNNVRGERNDGSVRECLAELKEKAESKDNLMPCRTRTVKTYASIGGIMETLEDVFGTFQEPLNI